MSPMKKKSTKATKQKKGSNLKRKAKGAKAEEASEVHARSSGSDDIPVESISKIQASDISHDQLSGRPRKIRGDFDLPFSAARRAENLSGNQVENSIAPVVRAFLKANTDQTRLRADESSLKLTKEVETRSTASCIFNNCTMEFLLSTLQ